MITANDAATTQDPFAKSAGLLGGAADIYKNMGQDSGSLTNINQYINPFYEQVLNSVLGRMDTDLNKNLGRVGDMATAAGAFGGSRHGLLEAETIGQHNLNVGDVSSQLSMAGWQDAADRAYRDQVTSAGGQTSLGNNYFDIGSNIMNTQAQQGQQQQNWLQAMLGEARGMYDSHANNPMAMIDVMSALLSGDPRKQAGSAERQTTPGLFDYLSLGLQLPWGK